jgi:transposase
MLEQLLRHIEFPDDTIAAYDRRVEMLTAADADALARLDTIPGVVRRTAETIVAELGGDMSRFPTAGHAASSPRNRDLAAEYAAVIGSESDDRRQRGGPHRAL